MMTESRISILLIEDDEDDYTIFKHYLKAIKNWKKDLKWINSPAAVLQNIGKQKYDICFIDYDLGATNGMEIMHIIKETGFDAPIVFLTGKGTHEVDLQTMKEGAADYLEKKDLNIVTLERVIRYTITRAKVIDKLQKSEKRFQQLSSKLINTLENERKLIAREIHDGIASSLTAINFALKSEIMKMKSEEGTPYLEPLKTIAAMLTNTIDESENICSKLRPSILDDFGLVKTISWTCKTFRKFYDNIRIKTNIEIEDEDVPERLHIVIYRIIQEALNNIQKHSRADEVQIHLNKTDQSLRLIIQDQGIGFDKQKMENSEYGMGINSMKERAELSNGNFDISSQPGKGTTIEVNWFI